MRALSGLWRQQTAAGLVAAETFHFVGIGGIGMSGIAEFLHQHGYRVQGSDPRSSPRVTHLKRLGIEVFAKQTAANIKGADVVVFSSAVGFDNPELAKALKDGVPIIRRSDMLSELMRTRPAVAVGGSHGKTTVTSLIAHILEKGGLDPTVIIGGIANSWGSNLKLGNGEWMVCEADESDGSFTKLPATAMVVTNIEAEHLNHYGNFANLEQAFYEFASNPPFYGFSVLCNEGPAMKKLAKRLRGKPLLTVGFKDATVTATRVAAKGFTTEFNLGVAPPLAAKTGRIKVTLPLCGEHNVLNALCAAAVALRLGMSPPEVAQALGSFAGVERRFSKVAEVGGITIIDDYAHHPSEIKATLRAARQLADKHRLIAVMEPHRYSRLAALFGEYAAAFVAADSVIITDIYPAGEKPLPGIHGDALAAAVRQQKSVFRLKGDHLALPHMINDLAADGDIVVLMGAGNITRTAHELPKLLAKLQADKGRDKQPSKQRGGGK